MPNRQQWQNILDRTWFYTKVIFALSIFGIVTYGWGTFYPNQKAVSKVNSELDKYYVDLLNNHSAYEKFRVTRELMFEDNKPLDSFKLIKTLDKFSTTKDYDKRVIRMINKIRKMEEK
mgnify:CR=1 FL=1